LNHADPGITAGIVSQENQQGRKQQAQQEAGEVEIIPCHVIELH
jgi:hypothetical protein